MQYVLIDDRNNNGESSMYILECDMNGCLFSLLFCLFDQVFSLTLFSRSELASVAIGVLLAWSLSVSDQPTVKKKFRFDFLASVSNGFLECSVDGCQILYIGFFLR